MNQFKDFGITIDTKPFTGNKIEMYQILNREIIVHDFKIEPSKFQDKGNGKRLCLQIKVDDTERIIFTGSTMLQQAIAKVSREQLPFKTIIKKENDCFSFN